MLYAADGKNILQGLPTVLEILAAVVRNICEELSAICSTNSKLTI